MTGPPAPRTRAHHARVPLMALGIVALITGLWGGLLRLGWPFPPLLAPTAGFHGPLMVSGFLGTVIGMERAVALGARWGFAAPLLTGLGALALIAGLPSVIGALLMTLGSASVVVIFVFILRRQRALFTVVMAGGAAAWLLGQLLWLLGWPIHRVVYWWAGFLVLTIAGERLELARLVRPSPTSHAVFLAGAGLFVSGLALATIAPDAGVRLVGVGAITLTVWLARHDVARRTVRQRGLTRFIALCLLSGYAWLGVSGALALLWGSIAAGPRYDAMLHTLFLGFAFAMIFGHAPIIFPAVLGWRISFRPAFYTHLALLHLTLLLRIAGDLVPSLPARQWGGLLNVVTLVLFLANTAYGILRPVTPRSPS